MPESTRAIERTERDEMWVRRADGSLREHRIEEHGPRGGRVVERRFYARDGREVGAWWQTATWAEVLQVLAGGGNPFQRAVRG